MHRAEDAKDVLLSAVVLEYLEGCRLRQAGQWFSLDLGGSGIWYVFLEVVVLGLGGEWDMVVISSRSSAPELRPSLANPEPGRRKRVDQRDRVRTGGLGLVKPMPAFSDVDGAASGGHVGL